MLQDLENYLKNRQEARITSLQAMGNELISLNIMADSVGLEVRNLTERWASLNEKVVFPINRMRFTSYIRNLVFRRKTK